MSQEDLYLQHYGVLGMHWGIRRYQNKDGTLTSKGKKHYSIKKKITQHSKQATNKIKKTASQTSNNFKKMNKADQAATLAYAGLLAVSVGAIATKRFNRLPNKDMLIKSGKTLYRTVTKNKTFDFSDIKMHDIAYATPFKRDAVRYQGYFGLKNAVNGGLFKNKVKTGKFVFNKDINVAGLKSQRKVFNDLIKNDPEFKKRMARSYNLKLPNSKLNQRISFNQFNRQAPIVRTWFYNERLPEMQAYTKALKKKGYQAFVDHNDAKGMGLGTKYPVILIDQGKNVVQQIF